MNNLTNVVHIYTNVALPPDFEASKIFFCWVYSKRVAKIKGRSMKLNIITEMPTPAGLISDKAGAMQKVSKEPTNAP